MAQRDGVRGTVRETVAEDEPRHAPLASERVLLSPEGSRAVSTTGLHACGQGMPMAETTDRDISRSPVARAKQLMPLQGERRAGLSHAAARHRDHRSCAHARSPLP